MGSFLDGLPFMSNLDCLPGKAGGPPLVASTELRTLAGITEGTEQAWRKRGIVDYILFGNVYYYPRKPLTGRLGSLVRERRRVPAKAVL